jgi:hypothetical protein
MTHVSEAHLNALVSHFIQQFAPQQNNGHVMTRFDLSWSVTSKIGATLTINKFEANKPGILLRYVTQSNLTLMASGNFPTLACFPASRIISLSAEAQLSQTLCLV